MPTLPAALRSLLENRLIAAEQAARYAARMLPGIFRNEDPTLRVRLAPEGRHRLESLLGDLPASVFTAEDSLGWCSAVPNFCPLGLKQSPGEGLAHKRAQAHPRRV